MSTSFGLGEYGSTSTSGQGKFDPAESFKVLCGWGVDSPLNTCMGMLGQVAMLACSVAIFIIGALGVAGILPVTTVAGSAIGLIGGGLLVNLLSGNPCKPGKISLILCSIIGAIPTITVGALGLTGVLTVHQLGIALLVLNGGFPAMIAGAIACSPLLSCCSSLASSAMLANED